MHPTHNGHGGLQPGAYIADASPVARKDRESWRLTVTAASGQLTAVISHRPQQQTGAWPAVRRCFQRNDMAAQVAQIWVIRACRCHSRVHHVPAIKDG